MFSKRLFYYTTAGLCAGLFLMFIEAIDRSFVLRNLFSTNGERVNFYLALSLIPTGTVLFCAIIAALCSAGERIFAKISAHPSTGRSWQQLPVGALIIWLPIALIAIFAPSIFSSGFHEIVVGVNDRIFRISLVNNHSTLILCITLYFTAIVLIWLDSESFARLCRYKWIAIPGACLLLCATLTFYWADSRIFVGRYFYFFHVPLTLMAIAGSVICGLIIAQQFKISRVIIASASLIIFVIALIGIYRFDNNQSAKALFWRRGVIGRKYLALAQNIFDLDRDGFSPFMGGGDCNDFDASINPLAREIQNNNRDENCFGAEAQTPLKNYAELNMQPLNGASVKNILFITVDCLRADHLGCYNYFRKLSPNIDKFAEHAIVFENAFSLGTNTGHSFTSIARSGHGEAMFDDDIPTVAETFVANNHSTAAITSPQTEEWLQKEGWESYKRIMLKGVQTIVHNEGGYWNSKKLTDRTIQYLKDHKDNPFYLWVHYNDLHAKNEHYKKLGKRDFGSEPVDIYDANLAFTDDHMGRLLDYIGSSGLLENTLIVISADHGEEFLEHGQQFHNGRPYRIQTNVPLILWRPATKPERVRQPVSLIDLGPTFLRAAGIMPSREYAGVDLLKTVAGQTANRQILIETPRNVPQGDSFAWAIVDGDWRFIYDLFGHTFELYNGKTDPAEHVNLIDREPAKAKEMAAALNQWLDIESQHKGYRKWVRF